MQLLRLDGASAERGCFTPMSLGRPTQDVKFVDRPKSNQVFMDESWLICALTYCGPCHVNSTQTALICCNEFVQIFPPKTVRRSRDVVAVTVEIVSGFSRPYSLLSASTLRILRALRRSWLGPLSAEYSSPCDAGAAC